MAYTTINKSSDYFNTITYTGDAQPNTNRSAGFEPGWIWIKQRNGTGNHRLLDSVRGANKLLYSTGTNAEDTSSMISAITSTGYTTSNTDSGNVNGNGESYVNWFWKANGAGSANTDGTISSTVSANTTSGFSIVKYTGNGSDQTVGHGLGVAPSMIIVKCLTTTHDWVVYHQSMGNGKGIALNLPNVEYSATAWQNTSPTNQVFYIKGGANSVSQSGDFIAYCFAEKTGYSKFGSYVGNGNADGTFIYTGFTPSFFLIKRTDGTNSWRMWDNKRDPFNVRDSSINANESDAEYTDASVYRDFVSNGVKIRSTGDNVSGGNYIYMAFAQAPLVGSNGVTAKAR